MGSKSVSMSGMSIGNKKGGKWVVKCLATKLCGTEREMIWCPKHSQLHHFLTHDLLHAFLRTLSTTFHGGESLVHSVAAKASEPVSQIWSQWRQLPLPGLVPTSLSEGMFHGHGHHGPQGYLGCALASKGLSCLFLRF